jgi:hypothetical protein
MAAKKNFDGVTSQLAEQAKQRFNPADNIDSATNKKESKKQKTVYLTSDVAKLLKKAAYIKDIDQSEIVETALMIYFKYEGIRLVDGE